MGTSARTHTVAPQDYVETGGPAALLVRVCHFIATSPKLGALAAAGCGTCPLPERTYLSLCTQWGARGPEHLGVLTEGHRDMAQLGAAAWLKKPLWLWPADPGPLR